MSDSNEVRSRFSGRTVIITGGANGIGRATALRFGREGAAVVVADTDAEQGSAAVTVIQDEGGEALFVETDVTSTADVDHVVGATIEHFSSIDILINNAGLTRDGTLQKMSEGAFDEVVDVNMKGAFHCAKAAVPYMEDQQDGRILNAASIVGRYGNFGQSNYVAAKAGVIGMTKTWARELGPKGITVNAVAPGFIDTAMVSSVPETLVPLIKEKTPLRRFGSPEEVASAYLFLASDDASFITGTVLGVDGGLVA